MIYLKVYRVIPSAFFTNDTDGIFLEEIYYEMGYASFLGKSALHINNNLQCEGNQGKYFFLFFEDAVILGRNFLFQIYRIYVDTFSIIEYDVPDDVLLKHIGCGSYSLLGGYPVFRIETFIEEEDLGNSAVFSNQIEEDEKLRALESVFKNSLQTMVKYSSDPYTHFVDCEKKNFKDSLQTMVNYSSISYTHFVDREKKIFKDCFGVDDISIIDDDKINGIIAKSKFYSDFLNQSCALVSSDFITGKILPVNCNFLSAICYRFEGHYNKLVKCDLSSDHKQFKAELSEEICRRTIPNDKIKMLLKARGYMK